MERILLFASLQVSLLLYMNWIIAVFVKQYVESSRTFVALISSSCQFEHRFRSWEFCCDEPNELVVESKQDEEPCRRSNAHHSWRIEQSISGAEEEHPDGCTDRVHIHLLDYRSVRFRRPGRRSIHRSVRPLGCSDALLSETVPSFEWTRLPRELFHRVTDSVTRTEIVRTRLVEIFCIQSSRKNRREETRKKNRYLMRSPRSQG